MHEVEKYIRSIPDFPEPGIIFRDVTTVMKDPNGLKIAIDSMIDKVKDLDFDVVVGLEARGFALGTPIAYALNKGFVLVRKKGKLPCETISEEYDLEYGTAEIEIHVDAIKPGQRVVITDDLIATGGTVKAAIDLVKIPIYHTTEEDVLNKGAGHLEGSSLPVGGANTHAVISAHRGLPSASLFTDLDQLKEGDHFLIHVLNETLSYEVDKISVVKPEETSSLAVEEGKDLVTLLTCTPYGVNTERLLVRGHRVPYVEQEVADEKTPLSGISLHTNYLLWVIIGLVITTIFILVLYLKEKKLQKKKNETS